MDISNDFSEFNIYTSYRCFEPLVELNKYGRKFLGTDFTVSEYEFNDKQYTRLSCYNFTLDHLNFYGGALCHRIFKKRKNGGSDLQDWPDQLMLDFIDETKAIHKIMGERKRIETKTEYIIQVNGRGELDKEGIDIYNKNYATDFKIIELIDDEVNSLLIEVSQFELLDVFCLGFQIALTTGWKIESGELRL